MSGFCLPYFTYDQFNLTAVPWSFLLRHGSALCLYGIAFAHWPGIAVTDWAETDRTLAIHLSAIIFVLTFWSACLYHYLVSAGRVQIDVRTGKIRGKGWVVRSSRRAHRVLLSLSLALSCMTLLQSIVTIMVITQFYLPEYAGKGIPLLILLKVDQTISLVIFIVALGRLFFEPVGLPKRKPEPINDLNGITKEGDEPSSAEVSLTVEMCNICDTNWSNRKLECGHLVCCCCLFRIWKETGFSNARCPYCRGDVYIVTKLHLIHGGNVDISSCCGLNRSEFADIERQSESLDYSVIAVPPPPES